MQVDSSKLSTVILNEVKKLERFDAINHLLYRCFAFAQHDNSSHYYKKIY